MKPWSLHVRMALSVSAIVIGIFSINNYFYLSVAHDLVRAQNQRRAELVTAQLAEHLSSEQGEGNLATLRTYVIFFKQIHNEVTEVRVYALTPTGFREVVTLPLGEPQRFPQEAITAIREQRTYSRVESEAANQFAILTSAPIEAEGKTVGAVALRLVSSEASNLVAQINRRRILLQVFAVIAVTLLIYLLLRRLVYRPVEQLLSTMGRAQAGDLSVEAPVGKLDEMGKLASGFNQMIRQIRRIQCELEEEQESLATRVHEATAELEDRNQQLEAASAQLFQVQRRLVQMERFSAAGQLAAEVAHEVGTPLNLISGHIQLLESELTEEPSQRRIEVIRAQIERIERIFRRMLDATRLPKLERVRVRLEELIHQTGEFIAPTLARQGVKWEVNIPTDLPPIKGSPEQLQEVFINLVDNSLDAMPAGGIIRVSARQDPGGQVIVAFEDSGQGMDEVTCARIFEPLFTTKRDGLGTGLGLSIVRQIIRDHEGTIDVESSPDHGTRFTLKLPAAQWVGA